MKVEGAVWRFNFEHNGIEISFPGKPDETIRDQLKGAGFKWSGRSRVWYAKGRQDRVDLAKELAEKGDNVGEDLTFADKMAKKEERAENRAVRFAAKAEKASERSDELIERAHKMSDIIPFGQPILIGHHSEGRDRNYRDKIQNTYRRAVAEDEKAKYFENRANASGDFKERTYNVGALQRKICECDKNIRRIVKYMDLHIYRSDSDRVRAKRGLQDERLEFISKSTLNSYEKMISSEEEKLSYWRGKLDEKIQDGKVAYDSSYFKPGMRVRTSWGLATVKKVNKKTLGVWFDQDNLNCVSDKIKGFKIPYDGLPQNCIVS